MDKVQKILSEIATRKLCTMDEHMAFYNDKAKEDYRLLSEIEELIKALQEEPVSEDLEEVAKQNQVKYVFDKNINKTTLAELKYIGVNNFKDGARWKEQQMMAKAIDGVVICDEKLTFGYRDIVFEFPEELKVGDKVKMIIIKE